MRRILPATTAAIILSLAASASLAKDKQVIYMVVINHEEQYSIWPKGAPLEKGWKAVGYPCVKYECIQYLDKVWTDMRPKSIPQFVDKQLARAKSRGLRVD